MRHTLLIVGLIGAGLLMLSPSTGMAQCVGAISWGETHAYETDYDFAAGKSNKNSILTIVGTVDCFSGPFAGFDPTALDYTVVIDGLVSDGTILVPNTGPFGDWTLHKTVYRNGTLKVWEDDPAGGGYTQAVFTPNPPNGDVPSTFSDGILFVEGTVDAIVVNFFTDANGDWVTGDFNQPESATGVFTGGREFSRVENCGLLVTGGWNTRPISSPAGYTAELAGKADADCPVPTEQGTWGRVKGLYR